MLLDIKIFQILNNLAEKSHFLDSIVIFFAGYFQYFLIVFFLLLLFFSRCDIRKKIYIFLVTVLSALIARPGVTEFIRFLYHRPRPFVALGTHHLLSENEWSFPSGHAAFFFAMAAAIYLYNKKWGVGFFIASIIISASRVIAGIHYPSDILGGALIGITVACVVYYFFDGRIRNFRSDK